MTRPDLQGILDRFLAGYSDPSMHTYLNFLVAIVAELRPRHILEVGTGDGWGARIMMPMVPKESRLTTVKYPEQTAEALEPWIGTKRLNLIDVPHGTVAMLLQAVDFLFLHHGDRPYVEWERWQPHLDSVAVVAVDCNQSSDPAWWTSLPYDKIDTALHGADGFGLFIYERTP